MDQVSQVKYYITTFLCDFMFQKMRNYEFFRKIHNTTHFFATQPKIIIPRKSLTILVKPKNTIENNNLCKQNYTKYYHMNPK